MEGSKCTTIKWYYELTSDSVKCLKYFIVNLTEDYSYEIIPKAMLRYQPRGKGSLNHPMKRWSENPQKTSKSYSANLKINDNTDNTTNLYWPKQRHLADVDRKQ
ncbi:hypothetical protein C0J52_15287 [Blattella germanica]|nr:hypothetical protein C0J52_15287 [Blattella germanica]